MATCVEPNDTEVEQSPVAKKWNQSVKKGTLPAASRWPRISTMCVTITITLVMFVVDRLVLSWAPNSTMPSVLEDPSIIFCLLGVCTSLLLFRGSHWTSIMSFQKQPKKILAEAPASGQRKWAPTVARSPVRAELCSKTRVAVAESTTNQTLDQKAILGSSHARVGSAARLNFVLSQEAVKVSADKVAQELQKLEAEGWETDIMSYNIVIRAFAKQGDLRTAERWLDRLRKKGIVPNEHSFVSIMSCLAKAGEVEAAEAMMKRMQQAGVVATGMSFTMLIHACTRLGRTRQAEVYIEEMQKAGFLPGETHYNALIHACGMEGNVQAAERWRGEMDKMKIMPTVITFTALIDACAKSSNTSRAEYWMQQMLSENLVPNVVTYCTMINACAKVGDLSRAQYWYDFMVERDVKPNAHVFSAIINACAQEGNVTAARLWLSRAEQAGTALDAVVYCCVMNASGKAGDAEGAMATYKQMRCHGIRSHVVVYGTLVHPFAYRGDWVTVEEIAREMVADGIAMNDYVLYSRLMAFSRGKPKQAELAEAAFLQGMRSGLKANIRIIKALGWAVGRNRCAELASLTGYSKLVEELPKREAPLPCSYNHRSQRDCERNDWS